MKQMKPGGAIYSPEFDLVLACLRWPQEPSTAIALPDLLRSSRSVGLTCSRSSTIIRWCRSSLATLTAFAPGYMPDEQAAGLRAPPAWPTPTFACIRTGAPGRFASPLPRATDRSEDLQGHSSGHHCLPGSSLRDAGDIDLLVAENDIFKAGEILEIQATCVSSRSAAHPRRLQSYPAHQKHFSYGHPTTGTHRSPLAAFPKLVPACQRSSGGGW